MGISTAKSYAITLIGLVILLRSIYSVTRHLKAFRESGGDLEDYVISFKLILQVLIGAIIMLYGGSKQIGNFKPLRIKDSKRVSWDHLHTRPNFHVRWTRAKMCSTLIQSFVPLPAIKR